MTESIEIATQNRMAPVEDLGWPRIALVTPVFNSAKYIEATIRSVLMQEYPNLDYFIVDGGSTDGTVEIIRKYASQISGWLSEPDNGMYDAVNKGFARTNGEIMGWISATDVLRDGGLAIVGSVFRDLPEVEWITGRPTVMSEQGMTVEIHELQRWSRYRYLAGMEKFIQQESTFWRRSLWERAGGYVDASRRYMSDFELWARFFRHARLYSVDGLIGAYRWHDDALGRQEHELCARICEEIVAAELNRPPRYRSLLALRRLKRVVGRIPKVRGAWNRFIAPMIRTALRRMPGPDLPPVIRYHLWYEPRKWFLRPR